MWFRVQCPYRQQKCILRNYDILDSLVRQLSSVPAAAAVSPSSSSSSSSSLSSKSPIVQLEEIRRTGRVPSHFNFANDVFDHHVMEHPSRCALWMESDTQSQKWTFAQLHKETIRSSIALNNILPITGKNSSSSSPPPPIILTMLPRVPQWWFLHLATLRIGAVFCPATTMSSPQDIVYRLQASQAQVVITDAPNMWKIEEAQRLGQFKNLRKIVVGDGFHATDWIQYNDLVDSILDFEVLRFKNVHTKSDSLAQIFFTSGTTGKPKMVAHSHASYGIGHCLTAKLLDLKGTDVMWNISDPGWAKSSYSSFYAPWIAGSTVYIHQMERVEPKKVLQALRERDITTLCAPPTLYRFMVQENDPAVYKFKSLRNCFGAGEAVNPEVSHKWQNKTGLCIHEFYGQTETVTIGPSYNQPKKDGSIGRIVGFDIRIVDEKGTELDPKEEGNIAVKIKPTRPVGLFQGYLKTDSKGLEVDDTLNCFVGDYYLTGDRGYLDDDGYLFLVGRSDDVIISAGYRIGPYEVESVLLTHEAVAESAAVAYPDEERGSVVKAFIVLNEKFKGSEPSSLIKNIQEFMKTNTAPYKYPRRIQFVENLPKTVSGKILRRELRAAL